MKLNEQQHSVVTSKLAQITEVIEELEQAVPGSKISLGINRLQMGIAWIKDAILNNDSNPTTVTADESLHFRPGSKAPIKITK